MVAYSKQEFRKWSKSDFLYCYRNAIFFEKSWFQNPLRCGTPDFDRVMATVWSRKTPLPLPLLNVGEGARGFGVSQNLATIPLDIPGLFWDRKYNFLTWKLLQISGRLRRTYTKTIVFAWENSTKNSRNTSAWLVRLKIIKLRIKSWMRSPESSELSNGR